VHIARINEREKYSAAEPSPLFLYIWPFNLGVHRAKVDDSLRMSALLLMHYSNGRGVINAQIKRTDKANSKYCFLITPRESERRVQQKGKRGKQNALS